MTNGTQTIFRGYAEEISNELKRSEIGSHLYVEYSDLLTLREMYSYYTKSALHNDNEIVVILPFYETKDKVREILSEDSAWWRFSFFILIPIVSFFLIRERLC